MLTDWNDPYDGPGISPHMAFIAILLMVLGLFLMSVSFQYFIFTIATVGFIGGAIITWILLTVAEPLKERYPHPTIIFTCVTVAGGLVVAGVSITYWSKTMYLVGALAGFILSVFLWSWKADHIILNGYARNFTGLGLALSFGFSMLLIEFLAVILSTSFIGAYVFIFGLDLLVRTGMVNGPRSMFDLRPYQIYYHTSDKIYAMLAGVLGLWLVSMIFQLVTNRGRRFGISVVKKET